MLIAFTWQQWFAHALQCYVIRRLPVLFVIKRLICLPPGLTLKALYDTPHSGFTFSYVSYTVEPLITDTAGDSNFVRYRRCTLVGVRQETYGGNSGNRNFVLYWRCPLIRVSVIRGSTVIDSHIALYRFYRLVVVMEAHCFWYDLNIYV
jgi:hypothetical protein